MDVLVGTSVAGGSHPKALVVGLVVWLLAVSLPAGADRAVGQAAYEPRSDREALRLLRPLTEQGDAQAQHLLGRMYERGQGVHRGAGRARAGYGPPSKADTPVRKHRVAVAYAFGLGRLARDRAAAVQGPQRVLARADAEGRFGLPVDARRAEYWRHKAEGQG